MAYVTLKAILSLVSVLLRRTHQASQLDQLDHVSITRVNTFLEFRFLLNCQMWWRPGKYQLKWCNVCGAMNLGIVFLS